ncbi:cell division protein FtsQ/DivIB [Zhouia spongiae]|uniref:Cell division protein FtsQ/DivIB n=1 Tax=Zhouia spongiae TaxID=2202721 RepID=A0ABY3YMN6_9FLAO|nr:cell division protein FtsQ/DivIB [Zhouia spongiae]UNY99089.1 cell division protein FtsQ/DivIB [Zhouia spongiae]
MRVKWRHIKLPVLILGVVGLYSFTVNRNAARKMTGVEIRFADSNQLFITYEMVNKLLIQKNKDTSGVRKDELDLNILEQALNSNDMIQNAHVYLTVNGELGAKVKQRKPIARVNATVPFYIDSEGKPMPLSSVFSARVPIITGDVKKDDLKEIYGLADYIRNDEFLKKHIVGIHKTDKNFELKLRVDEFIVMLGDTENLDNKFFNFKAFYQKAIKDRSLSDYKAVNLKFNNQVVCTKK